MEKGTALVFGASGGIGAAFVTQLQARGQYDRVIGLSRQAGDFDLEDEASLAAVASRLADEPPVRMVIVATGLLSDATRGPDKSLRALDADWMMQNFRINSIGPALIARHIVPLMPRTGRSVFAALSARVGSISDNRLGGWHSYRASKAALNMLIRTIAIDLARTHPDAVCVSLHPGTVDTELSRPFQRGIADGQIKQPDDSARALIDVIDSLSPSQTGRCFAWDGQEISP